MNKNTHTEITKEISCRVTRTLLMYVQENNNGTLGNLLDGLPLDADFCLTPTIGSLISSCSYFIGG